MEVQLAPLQLRLADDLHQCEQADEGNGKIEAQIQAVDAEGKAVIAGHGVCTHAGDEQAEASGDDALDEALARNACDDGHAEQADHEVLRRAQLCRNFGTCGPRKSSTSAEKMPPKVEAYSAILRAALVRPILDSG